MKWRLLVLTAMVVILSQGSATAKVDLVILPTRDQVQVTIYNSADLTLVREKRELTVKKGPNHLQFSWANTLIDPTSLEMLPKMRAEEIDVVDLTFPPRVRELGLWNVLSRFSGNLPVEITYLTSGLSWRAFYMGVLNADETTMHLEGYVRIKNDSGEDYDNAQVRVIVGKIHLVDQIAELARRQYPYGRPGPVPLPPAPAGVERVRRVAEAKMALMKAEDEMREKPKEIRKEGLSEYFLYTIEGTETIPHGASKRLLSFESAGVPVRNLYKFEEERYGNRVMRFLSFKNDKAHNLGETPIPGGALKVFRDLDGTHLDYEGQSEFKYIPVDEDVEVNLGAVRNIIVRPRLMDYKTARYLFDNKGDISGWDEIHDYEVELKNTREIPVQVEIKRNFNTSSWDIENKGDFGDYEKEDVDTVKFKLSLAAHERKRFGYRLTIHQGRRAE